MLRTSSPPPDASHLPHTRAPVRPYLVIAAACVFPRIILFPIYYLRQLPADSSPNTATNACPLATLAAHRRTAKYYGTSTAVRPNIMAPVATRHSIIRECRYFQPFLMARQSPRSTATPCVEDCMPFDYFRNCSLFVSCTYCVSVITVSACVRCRSRAPPVH